MEQSGELNASCLCGDVRFVVRGDLGQVHNCHCTMCRKAHAAAYRTRVGVGTESFAWTAGEDRIGWYESSPGTFRGFCTRCGTRLVSKFDEDPSTLGVPLALFDTDPGVRPEMHVHVASKADWYEICDDLPRFEGGIDDG